MEPSHANQPKARERLSGYASLILVAGVIAGGALAALSAEYIFRAVPTDISLIGIVLDALDDENLQPDIVAFGNSVAMASFDGRILNTALPGNPKVLNLATTGQSTVESYLFYQELPKSVTQIVQFIDPVAVTKMVQINPQKYNAFYMLGYRPDNRTRAMLTEIFEEPMQSLLNKPEITHIFESRWAVKQAADFIGRSFFRQDLQLDRRHNDLEYPATGASRLPDRLLERAIKRRYDTDLKSSFRFTEKKRGLLTEMTNRAKNDGREIVLVLSPAHPAAYIYAKEGYYAKAREALSEFGQENNVTIIDALDIVPGELYSDGVHPMDEGAKLVSNHLASKLAGLLQTSEPRN